MSFFKDCIIRHALTSSVSLSIKSSHSLYGRLSSHINEYSICCIFNLPINFEAITSLKGCCINGLLPPLTRHLLEFIIFHLFFKQPSDVLSGELKSNTPLCFTLPINTSPISSEKGLSKKFIFSHDISPPLGFSQY